MRQARDIWLVTVDVSDIPLLGRWSDLSVGIDGSIVGDLLLYRTGLPWDFLIAIGMRDRASVKLASVLKNAVPLWQLDREVADGPVGADLWALLGRLVLIHNPGMLGALEWLEGASLEGVPHTTYADCESGEV